MSTSTVGRMRASSARRPAVAALALTFLALLPAGCAQEERAAPEPAATPIGDLNAAAMQLPRIEFCSLVERSAVADALGGDPVSESAYGHGDEVELSGVGRQAVHELGCSWTGEDGASARAWVFARPVSPDFAQSVVATGRTTRGCRTVPGPAFGTPSTTQLCDTSTGQQRVRHAGLFGQTWLTCELDATGLEADTLRSRADQWCVAVADGLDTAR